MKSSKEVAELIKKYIEGNISSGESIQLNNWIKEKPEHAEFFKSVLSEDEVFEDAFLWIDLKQKNENQWLDDLKKDTLDRIHKKNDSDEKPKSFKWIYYAAAAMLLFGLFLGIKRFQQTNVEEIDIELSDINPGTNKAELILSNGKKLTLRSDKDGIVIDNNLEYSDGTHVLSLENEDLTNMTATIQVPKGGKYQVTLPDGSRVWLNSLSKLEYPLAFKKESRKVKLEGEGYFQVSKISMDNKRIPFEVESSMQTIEVTGTQFNISAYPEDAHEVSTLVEGSINVHVGSSKISLKPNQQSINNAGKLVKKDVDVSSYIAWKENKFLFYETELRDVMKGLSRWYDIEVSYQGHIEPTYFYGEIGREKNLSEVLRMIEKSGVKFKLIKTGKTNKLIVIQ